MKIVMRVLAGLVVAGFVGMNVWAGLIWAAQGPPPAVAYMAEFLMLAVVVAYGFLWWIVEHE